MDDVSDPVTKMAASVELTASAFAWSAPSPGPL
jgi:hypothetical protein